MVKNLALWGYGYHGKNAEAAILRSHTDKFCITAIFDVRFEELNLTEPGHNILDPAKVKEYYKEGLFDAVKITVYDKEQKTAIASRLDVMGIPVDDDDEMLDNSCFFRGPEYFRQGQAGFSWQERDGYRFNVLRDMRMSFIRTDYTAFISDRDGYMLSSIWRPEHFLNAPSLKMYMPPKSEDVVFMRGEWCFLGTVWSDNYWHFVYECLDHIRLLEKSGYTGRYILPKQKFAEELTALLGLAPERIAWREDFDHDKVYQFETLVCVELLQNDRKKSAPVLLEVSKDILSRIQHGESSYPRRVFVKRVGMRRLILDKGIEKLLEEFNLKTIVPEKLPVTEQILYFNRADIVISPHGANSANSLFMCPGKVFIETFPVNYINPCCLDTSYCGGLNYLQVIEPFSIIDDPWDQKRDYGIDRRHLEIAIREAIRLTE